MLIADTHFHLYPSYDRSRLFSSCLNNMLSVEKLAFGKDTGSSLGVFYAMTPSQPTLKDIQADKEFFKDTGFQLINSAPTHITIRSAEKNREFLILAATQLKTSENLEVLAAGCLEQPERPLSLHETTHWVRSKGFIPILLWGFGKWTLSRARLIEKFLREQEPRSLLIGDTSLRSRSLPESRLMTLCRMRGFKVLAGTDPLPIKGDETFAGRFLTAFEGNFDPANPVESINRLLLGKTTRIGRRNHLFEASRRVRKMFFRCR